MNPSQLDDPILRLADATVVKNGVHVLDRLTMTIRAGEHTAILGPNGAGKTSLINLLTHQDRALAQEDGAPPPVEVFGDSRWNIFELRSYLGIVSQDLHQRFVAGNSEGSIRGEDAVLSGLLSTYGIVRHSHVTDAMRRRAAEALARVGATHLAEKLLNEMSTGEARRVLIARALLTEPRALVLDEPTAGLTEGEAMRVVASLSHLRRRQTGLAMIVVSHDVKFLEALQVDRVVVLHQGRLFREGEFPRIREDSDVRRLFWGDKERVQWTCSG